MDLIICEDRYCLGRQAAAYTARCLRDAVAQKGGARLVISAGESQLETYVALMRL